MPKCRTVRHPVGPVQEYEQKCQCRNQSVTEIRIPVTNWDTECRNADAVAQLWGHPNFKKLKDDLNLHHMVGDWPDLVAIEGEGLQVGQTTKHRSVHLHQLILCQDAATNYNYNITKLLQQITITTLQNCCNKLQLQHYKIAAANYNYKLQNYKLCKNCRKSSSCTIPRSQFSYIARFQPG